MATEQVNLKRGRQLVAFEEREPLGVLVVHRVHPPAQVLGERPI